MHPYLFDDFLMAQSVQRGHHGLGDLNATNKLPLCVCVCLLDYNHLFCREKIVNYFFSTSFTQVNFQYLLYQFAS